MQKSEVQKYFDGMETVRKIDDVAVDNWLKIDIESNEHYQENRSWYKDFEKFLSSYDREIDKIYYFRSSEDSWLNMAGREGYCIVRNGILSGEIVDSILIAMS